MNLLDGVAEFMRLSEQSGNPTFNDPDLRALRRDLLAEEYAEYTTAENNDDLIEVVDALLDIIVIAWGTLIAYVGEDKAKAAAAEVTRSNLDKVTGQIRRREDGKILKPEGWEPPNIRKVLDES